MPQPKCPVPPNHVKYPNVDLATRALQRDSQRRKGKEPRVWRCLFCGGFHGQYR